MPQGQPTPERTRRKILRMWREGVGREAIADVCGVSRQTVSRTAHAAGLYRNASARVDVSSTEVLRLYRRGWSAERVGERVGLSRGAVRGRIRGAGGKVRPRPAVLTPRQRVAVARRYLAGESTPQLAARYGISSVSIRLILVQAGVPRRPRGRPPKRPA